MCYKVGGIPVIMKALLDGGLLHGDCITVTGKTMAENLKDVVFPDGPGRDLSRLEAASRRPAAWSACSGNLAPDGAIVKVAGMKQACASRAPALCFDREEDAFAAVQARAYKAGDVIVIRYEGPKGGPGMREMLSTTAAIYGQGMGEQGRADHRRPLLRRARAASASAMSGRRRRSAARSPCCRTATGSSSTPRRAPSTCWCRRRNSPPASAAWQPRRTDYNAGAIWKYAQLVGPAQLGAVTHPGGAAESHCYADI